jgi:hypothetical protein
MSIIHRMPQGSVEWWAVRSGMPTSSNFHKVVTPGGKLSEQRHKYLYRLVAERLLAEPMEDQLHVEWVEHGREMEPFAAAQFQFLENCELEPVGFITTDDNRLGCSPDRLLKDKAEAVEIKCASPPVQIGRLLDGLDNDYKPQVQGQLLVGQFERVHFYSFHDRMPGFHLITLPDKAYQKILRQHLADFVEELDAATDRARALGVYQPSPAFERPIDRIAPGRDPDAISVIPD